jgi:hypothetical protein
LKPYQGGLKEMSDTQGFKKNQELTPVRAYIVQNVTGGIFYQNLLPNSVQLGDAL